MPKNVSPHLTAQMDQVYARARDEFAYFVAKAAELIEQRHGDKALAAALIRTHIDMAWGYEVARSIAAVAIVEWADLLRAANARKEEN